MEERWWSELAGTHGIRRDDRSTWHQIPGNLKAAKRDPLQGRILTATVRGIFDDLLGPGTWSPPRDWGVTLVTFPEPGDMVFCHPAMVHCRAPNRGTWPRFMRIRQQFLTHEARARLRDFLR